MDMDDWKPDGSGKKTRMNCEGWGGNRLRWFIFCMQHWPGPANGLQFEGKPLSTWWVFIGDYDLARETRFGLVQKQRAIISPRPWRQSLDIS